MSHDVANTFRLGLFGRIAQTLGLRQNDKQPLSSRYDRMQALDDRETRRAIANLPPHLLRDIGVLGGRRVDSRHPTPEGEALRRHLW
ncbi:hypothetical protein ACFOMH_09665 [Paracoccus mangrovi]|uniref:DUF1127 domain-containing protein n=1 Tax=Paracoccus mangrovi TaxID=1715645 RepID=A0ABV7R591_9RHOB